MARSGGGSAAGAAASGRVAGDRPARRPRPATSWRPGLLAGVLGALGFAVGLATMRLGVGGRAATRGFTGTLQFQAWVTIIAFQTALWGAVAPGLWRTAGQLWRRWQEGPGRRGPGLLLVGYLALVALIVAGLRSGPPNPAIPATYSSRTLALLLVALVVVLPPVAIGMWLVHGVLGGLGARLAAAPVDRASLEVDWPATGRPVFADLLWLRATLQQLLLVAGTIVGTATLASGALRLAVLAASPSASFPPEIPILYGGFFTVVLAILYVPAYTSLQRQARALVDACWPVPPSAKPDETWYKSRQNAEAALGLAVSVRESFQTGAAILAPLLTSIITVILPAKPG
jgi:hypothetical protein